jgi:hypothetical protein
MIFCAKNEDGIPTWKLVLEGKKTVTRRLKPLPVGKEFAIQPGRGKKVVARGKVVDCQHTWSWWLDWMLGQLDQKWLSMPFTYKKRKFLTKEAHKEGFKSWEGLIIWFKEHKIDINNTYRIEFELLEGK